MMRILYNHEWKPKRWFEIEMWLKMLAILIKHNIPVWMTILSMKVEEKHL